MAPSFFWSGEKVEEMWEREISCFDPSTNEEVRCCLKFHSLSTGTHHCGVKVELALKF